MGCYMSKNDYDRPPPYNMAKNGKNHPTSTMCMKDEMERSWEPYFEKAAQFRYEVWVSVPSLLDPQTGQDQMNILNHLNWFAKCGNIDIQVKSLDCLDNPWNSIALDLEEMLSCETRDELASVHKDLPSETPYKARIDKAMKMVKDNNDLSDSSVTGMVRVEVLVALTKLCKSWKLQDFVQLDLKSLSKVVEGKLHMKVQAQILGQVANALASLQSSLGSEPTVYINMVPQSITETSFDNIHEALSRITQAISAKKSFKNDKKQDLVSFQFVSIGTGDKSSQWTALDDANSGRQDFIDSLHLVHSILSQHGPGVVLAPKILLGSVESALDGKSDRAVYGKKWGWKCSCITCA
ncbi:hypothetical protein GQ44DRAFT_722550 [Phaeosphaeriaceae sp. PMI808]|nr:hypothetical protein GQ44DRAFT_722550 [Phaeosphaeriaceae sp. PMI808]